MKILNNSINGFTLPLTPGGGSSLVKPPPWHYGLDIVEISYLTDPQAAKRFLPEPLTLSHSPGLVSITISDMSSVSTSEDAYINPERTIYNECLIKIHCEYNGKPGWYVPAGFVNNDFTLLRGFIQGFSKKLSNIYLTKMDRNNPLYTPLGHSVKRKGICEVFGSIKISLGIEIEREVKEDCFAGNSMFTVRHFPDITNNNKPLIYDLTEVDVSYFKRSNIWEGRGEFKMEVNTEEEISMLQPIKLLKARTYQDSLTINGGKVIHNYI